jgi:hypothetical protein
LPDWQIDINSYLKGDYEEFNALRRRKNKANSKPISGYPGRKPADLVGCFGKWAGGDYSVISHAIATSTRAVIAMKMTMEPNKTTDSFRKLVNFIFGSFVVLYTTEIAATNGSNHNRECGVTPIFSGVVKVAITKAAIVDILFSSGPGSSQMGPVNGVYNTQKIEQPGDARVNLSDFVRPAENGIISRRGYTPQGRNYRRVHKLRDVPGLCSDGIDNPDRADI